MFRFLKRYFCKHEYFDATRGDGYYWHECKKCGSVKVVRDQDVCQHDYDLVDKVVKKPLQVTKVSNAGPEYLSELRKMCEGKVVYAFKCKKCKKINIESRVL
jgi:hypothetical protein